MACRRVPTTHSFNKKGLRPPLMRVLLITPYSPLEQHDHAASDIALPLVQALAPFMDLHVYAPGQRNGSLKSWRDGDVTYHSGSPVPQTRLNRLGIYPYAARESWSRQSTREVNTLVGDLRPDILHAEYFQAAEPLLGSKVLVPTSITLHDVTVDAPVSPRSEISRRSYWLQRLERVKTKRTMGAIVSKIDALFVRSENEKRKVRRAGGIVEVAPVGLNFQTEGWLGDRPHVAAFGGAMWRWENEATADYLARQVMPLVRQIVPDAELRIFGARPSASVRALEGMHGTTVVGEVADYDDEFRRAGVTLAPTMVDPGLLMKAIRAMAIGCPVVLNSASSSPIVGLKPGVHALVGDSPSEFASHVAELMQDRGRANQLGQAALGLVTDQFSWERAVEVYRRVFEKLIRDQ